MVQRITSQNERKKLQNSHCAGLAKLLGKEYDDDASIDAEEPRCYDVKRVRREV